MSTQARLSQREEPKENRRVITQSFLQKSSSRSSRLGEKLSEEDWKKAAKQQGSEAFLLRKRAVNRLSGFAHLPHRILNIDILTLKTKIQQLTCTCIVRPAETTCLYAEHRVPSSKRHDGDTRSDLRRTATQLRPSGRTPCNLGGSISLPHRERATTAQRRMETSTRRISFVPFGTGGTCNLTANHRLRPGLALLQ